MLLKTPSELALLTATRFEDVAKVRSILEAGDAPVDGHDRSGCSPLLIAAERGQVEIVELLLDHGANIEFGDFECSTALCEAASNGHLEVLRLLLARGAVCNLTKGSSPLHKAVEEGHDSIVNELLAHGMNVDVLDGSKGTALIQACNWGRFSLVKTLLEHGAAVHVKDSSGRSPFQIACRRGSVACIDILLDYGANPSTPLTKDQEFLARCVSTPILAKLADYVGIISQEWRPYRHLSYPLLVRRAVATIVALWSWNTAVDAPWHPEGAFHTLSLEIIFEIFIWLALDIATQGYNTMETAAAASLTGNP